VPSRAFKDFILATFPVQKAEHAYFTSGTTDPSRKGKIYRDKGAVNLINTANGLLTREYVFPDLDRMKILLMTPSPRMAPGIGMAIGLERVRTEFGTMGTTYLITPLGLNVELLLKSLIKSERTGEPFALIGLL
jgi:anaerobic magnesium-protoporphyrin IX monomethyl ester cyclase